MLYNGIYFDGKSSRPNIVKVEVTAVSLIIYPVIEDKINDAGIHWTHHGIQSADVSGSIVILKFGKKFPYQSLELDAPYLLEEVKEKAPDAPYLKNHFRKFASHGEKGIFIVLSFLLVFAVVTYFWIIPGAMVFFASIFPKNVEIELGNQMQHSIVHAEEVDSAKTVLINKFYRNLKVNTTYPVHITVVKSDVQNAFALPGGNLVVYTGILDHMDQYEELIALLGHEVGHVENRHTLKMLFKSLSNYIIISAIFQDVSGVFAVIVDHSSSIEKLSFSRQVEKESDEFGFDILQMNKANPEGMVNLFEQLNEDHGDATVPAFLSTHPQLSERIMETKKKIHAHPYTFSSNKKLTTLFNQLKDQ